MSRVGKISRGIIAVALLLILCFSSAAGEEKEKIIRAGCPSCSTETVVSRKGRSGYELYIPGRWDIGRITMEIEGSGSFFLENEEILPGTETDLRGFLGRTVTVSEGNRNRTDRLIIRQGSEIPAVFITVDGKALQKVNKSKKNVIVEGRIVYTEADGTVSYDGEITQLKGRGNNTFAYKKKPYQFKLEKKASLSGMAKAKTWILLANWNDISLLRNQIVLDMCREAGLRYALSCVQADVWINGVYNGLYLLTEKAQIKKERINLRDLEDETEALNGQPVDGGLSMFKASTKDLPLIRGYRVENNPEDITGGYLFTIEKYARLRDYGLAGFRTKKDLSVQIKEPTYPSREQTEYLGGLVSEMQQALIAKDGVNPQTGKSYREYIDVDSFALKYLAEEWCKNYDFIGGSQYMYKDSDERDPLIYAGPAWDYDLSFGNMRDRGYQATGNYMTAVSRKTSNLNWLLSRHADFADRVGELWRERFGPAAEVLTGAREAAEGNLIRPLDEYAAAIRASAEMNYARWGVGKNTDEKAGKSFENAVAYLKKWIAERTAFMDGVYGYAEKHE